MKNLRNANDTVLIVEKEMQSQEIVDIIAAPGQNKGLSLNIGRSQVMAITQQQYFKMQIHGKWA